MFFLVYQSKGEMLLTTSTQFSAVHKHSPIAKIPTVDCDLKPMFEVDHRDTIRASWKILLSLKCHHRFSRGSAISTLTIYLLLPKFYYSHLTRIVVSQSSSTGYLISSPESVEYSSLQTVSVVQWKSAYICCSYWNIELRLMICPVKGTLSKLILWSLIWRYTQLLSSQNELDLIAVRVLGSKV